MAGRRSVAVAGTHGKTSTTSMLTVAVQACGVDPSFAIGGDLNESGSNAHAGHRRRLRRRGRRERPARSCCSAPFGAIVTNVEADHLDNYGDLAAVEEAFDRFLRPSTRTASSSSAPTTRARRGCARVPRPARLRTYGARRGRRPAARATCEVAPDGTELHRRPRRAASSGRVRIRVPGEHMALNSAAALLAGLELGLPAERLIDGLARFGGVHRRFELKGVVGGVRVYDDYAHHPTEVAAAAARGPGRRRRRPAASWRSSRTSTAGPGEFADGLRRRRSGWPTRSW